MIKDKILASGIFTQVSWPNSDHGMFMEVPIINFSIQLESVGDLMLWGEPGMMMGKRVKVIIESVD